ncbi:MAG: DUF1007 family protein [Hyphomicrobiales bacterium]
MFCPKPSQWWSTCAALLALACQSVPAFSHPHIEVDMKTKLIFDQNGMITGLGLFWAFDENYSETAIEDLDKNKDGVYGPDELLPLTKANLEAINEYNYFTAVTLAGEPVAMGKPDLGHTLQLVSDGRLAMYFTLPLAKPVDPALGHFAVRIFDPEYYIAFNYTEQTPLLDEGQKPQDCALKLLPPPDSGDLETTRLFLSSKDTAWKPSPKEQYGGLFAQTVVVTCGKDKKK